MSSTPARVLLKLSGEILTDRVDTPICEARLNFIVDGIGKAFKQGVQIAIVLGAGNLVRGQAINHDNIRRRTADQMGMTATIINGLALRDALLQQQLPATLLSAIGMPAIAPQFDVIHAEEKLSAGHIIILAGGTGNPFVTTDSAASLRAAELNADIILKATKVDGVYDQDPANYPNATRFKQLSFADVLANEYGVMDLTAFCQCRDQDIPIRVFNVLQPGALADALLGGDQGTLIS